MLLVEHLRGQVSCRKMVCKVFVSGVSRPGNPILLGPCVCNSGEDRDACTSPLNCLIQMYNSHAQQYVNETTMS